MRVLGALLLALAGAPGYREGEVTRAARAEGFGDIAERVHLMTIGPDDQIGFEVGDAGRLQIAISPADLRRGRFGRRVCGIFDSG